MRETRRKNGLSRLIAVLGLAGLTLVGTATLGASDALALTALRQIQVSDGSRVDLLFDGKVSRSQIKTEFLRDIIQISLNGVSVYPAKISSVTGGPLTKIFAYQYSPRLVRCRLTVNGKAESYKNRVTVISGGPGGTLLTIRIGGASGEPARAPIIHDAAERALLNQVMKAKDVAPAPAAGAGAATTTDTITEKSAAPAGAVANANGGSGIVNTENRALDLDSARARHGSRLGGPGEFPSPLSALGKLALVIALFGAIAVAVKKIWKPGEQASSDSRLLGAIGRFARKNLGANLGSKKVAVEILANHHLGPKKSIAVIRVSGRTMVVGITEQSINLISQLSSEEDTLNALADLDSPPLDAAGASTAGPAVFSKLLQSEAAKPATGTPVASTRLAATTVRRDVRVTSYGTSSAATAVTPPASGAPAAGGAAIGGAADGSGVSARAAMGLSGVRAQIRSKLEGLKEI